ncbi:PTS sugar transporter subunit IIB [Erysipelothrix urinaevulpis]|uniref:PTS system mannose/fructose/N-acetylgalactosamine-transporter subunit IIB n=1 Tax=Erysipelothrix urinaevulpis TaxID=2683717 RepID=UPI00135674BC|nr:PTS sugar transporter subunit IIB [Erysipelothrix urinaevulpis]
MSIKLLRIDDRLIHGQVASSWLRHVGADQVICVDDVAASNPVQQQVLKMAAPDLKVHIFSVDEFINILQNHPIKRSTFLILTNTVDVLRLLEAGLDLETINFGGMRSKEGRIAYDHDLSFTDEELKALDAILAKGVDVTYQIAAYNDAVPIKDKLAEVKNKNE